MEIAVLEPPWQELACFGAQPLGTPLTKLRPLQIGPLEIRRVNNRGRGLFVTKACDRGRLLIVERAFCVGKCGDDLCRAVGEALSKSTPRDCRRFCALDGSGHHVEGADSLAWWTTGECLGGRAIVDAHAVERIVDLNSFHMQATDERKGSIKVDAAGMFPVAALLNHSCVPTASRYYYGDALLVRAARRLEAGEEVLCSYILSNHDLQERQESLLVGYGFQCSCIRCRLEGLVPAASRPRAASSADTLIGIGVCSVREALHAEALAIAAAPEAWLQEAGVAGLSLRGCLVSVSFPALMRRLGMISIHEPEFLLVAEIVAHAAGSVAPSSLVHSYCCSLALAAAGVGMHGGPSAVCDAASRALLVHIACFGGGAELWHHRIKGGPGSAHAIWALPWQVSQLLPMAFYCVPYPSGMTDTCLEADLLGAKTAADIATHISDAEIRIFVHGHLEVAIPLNPSELDSRSAIASFDRKHRRLRISFPGVRA